jgi:hypothetical protein
MAFSRIGSAPPQATRSWVSFLAPIGVTVLIIVPVSAALLSNEVEPVDRDAVEDATDFGEAEEVVFQRHSSQSGDLSAVVADVPRDTSRRRQGFSPAIRGEEELDSSTHDDDDDYDDDDYDDDDYDEVDEAARKERRARLTSEERAEILETSVLQAEKVPFLRGLPMAMERMKARREARAAGIAEEAESGREVVSHRGAGGAAPVN